MTPLERLNARSRAARGESAVQQGKKQGLGEDLLPDTVVVAMTVAVAAAQQR